MKKKKVISFLWKYFLRGLLYIVPLAVTVYVIWQIFLKLDGLIDDIEFFQRIKFPGLGVIILVVFITLMGFLGSSILGRPIINYFNQILKRAPLIKTIYDAIRDLLSAFVGEKKRFDKPVLVKVNNNSNLEKLGFITEEDLSDLGVSKDKVAVYMPHSYNFSGNLFIVPKTQIKPIDKNAAEVMKFIVSGGVSKGGL